MNERILLVEDSASDEKLALRAFKQCGIPHDVAVVRDGAEALDYLFASGAYGARDPADVPTVVLLDLKLPKIDGLEVLRRIRADERTKLLPIVVLTSSRQEADIASSFALGANAYVRKPLDYAEFAEAVKVLARFWLSLNEPPPARSPT